MVLGNKHGKYVSDLDLENILGFNNQIPFYILIWVLQSFEEVGLEP